MTDLLSAFGDLATPWIYVIVGLLAMLEASALVGLAVPGELALVTGGFLASQGRVSVVGIIGVAVLGAVAGDSIGYALGKRVGPALRASRVGRRVGERRWRRAEEFIRRRGGVAVFLARFVGVLRAVVPSIAGAAGMPYRTFAMWNIVGAVVWSPAVVLLGFAAGSSYRRVDRFLGQGSLLILVLLAVAVPVAVITARRRADDHPSASGPS